MSMPDSYDEMRDLGPFNDWEQARRQFDNEMVNMPLPLEQQKTLMLRMALLPNVGHNSVFEMNDDQPVMLAIAQLPAEVVTVIASWIFRAGLRGQQAGREQALKRLRRDLESGAGHSRQAVHTVDAMIDAQLSQYGIPPGP